MTHEPVPLSGPLAEPYGRPLPPRLAAALTAAHAAELVATGSRRRPAFRLTRALLGGARKAGYHPAQLAAHLGVSITSIQTRGGNDDLIAADTFARLTGIDPATVDRWHAIGALSPPTTDHGNQDCYPASELIQALTRAHPAVDEGTRPADI